MNDGLLFKIALAFMAVCTFIMIGVLVSAIGFLYDHAYARGVSNGQEMGRECE